jgi:hypothetical protein
MRHPQLINMKQNKYSRARTKEVKHNRLQTYKESKTKKGEVNCLKKYDLTTIVNFQVNNYLGRML